MAGRRACNRAAGGGMKPPPSPHQPLTLLLHHPTHSISLKELQRRSCRAWACPVLYYRSCYVDVSCCYLYTQATVSYSFPHAPGPRSQPSVPTSGLQLCRAAEAGSISRLVQGDSPVYSPFLLLPTPRRRCGLREWQHFPNPRAIDLE